MVEESTQAGHAPMCSFCYKSQSEVEKLVCNVPQTDQPRVYICNECILVCQSILRESSK
jgi:ATP-dependent protease Clp ATPase subunit